MLRACQGSLVIELVEKTELHRDLAPILLLVKGVPESFYPMHTQGPGEEAVPHFPATIRGNKDSTLP